MHAGPGNPVSSRPPFDPAAAWSSASSSVLSITPRYLVPGEQSAFRAAREPCTEGRRAQKDDSVHPCVIGLRCMAGGTGVAPSSLGARSARSSRVRDRARLDLDLVD